MIVRDGIKLAFEDRGTGKPAFVFVHGWACDRSFFGPQAEHFSRRHRTVSIDLRGHGESDKPQGAYPIAAHAEDIVQVIGRWASVKAWRSGTAREARSCSSSPPHIRNAPRRS
jgi:pimeloyl-ACP methyl ester carboxylesterase